MVQSHTQYSEYEVSIDSKVFYLGFTKSSVSTAELKLELKPQANNIRISPTLICDAIPPMLSQDMHFFYGWLSNENSQRRIDFIGLVYMVPIGAHSVSATMKITTTCSLNAPIRKHYGGMFVTDATFQE